MLAALVFATLSLTLADECATPPVDVDVIVVGGGLAGLTAAEAVTDAGYKVAVLEAGDYFGGRMNRTIVSEPGAPVQAVDFGGQWCGLTHKRLKQVLKRFEIPLFVAPFVLDSDKPEHRRILFAANPYSPEKRGQLLSFIGALGKITKLFGFIEGQHFPAMGITPDEMGTLTASALGVSEADFEDGKQAWEAFVNLVQETPFWPNGAKSQVHALEDVDYSVHPLFPHELVAAPGGEKYKWYDQITTREYINSTASSDFGRFMLENFMRINGCAGPSETTETSLLHKMWAYASGDPRAAPEYELIRGGAGQVPKLLETALLEKGAVMKAKDPVIVIKQDAAGAEVHTLNGAVYKSKKVVVAMPPALSNRIHYFPPTSGERHQLSQHYPMGTVAKMLISYETRWWRADGLTGFGQTDPTTGMLTVFADSSDPESGIGIIVSLIAGVQYDMFMASGSTEDERKAAVIEDLVRFLGPNAREYKTFNIGDWPNVPNVQGSYSGYATPNAWTRFGKALIEPHMNIHWAGTETARQWSGYFEGAILSGENAAEEVLAAL